MKDKAMVLDATAGNRHIWDEKEDDRVIFIDQEAALEIKPDHVMNNEETIFPDKRFHTIFYDPPHYFNQKSGIYLAKNHEESKAYWAKYDRPQYVRKTPGYYGGDIYKTRQKLLNHIGRAQHEFYRILTDDGCLWFKWNEGQTEKDQVLPLFVNWKQMISIQCEHPYHGLGVRKEGYVPPKTWWIMFMKKNNGPVQSSLKKQTKRMNANE